MINTTCPYATVKNRKDFSHQAGDISLPTGGCNVTALSPWPLQASSNVGMVARFAFK
jgi:hypothetical protein